MGIRNFLLFANNDRKRNRIFEGSSLDGPLRVCDGFKIEINLSTECKAEKSVFDLLTGIGFDIQLTGTKYIMRIFVNCVNNMYVPSKTAEYYEIVRQKYGGRVKIIENAIIRAIDAVKLSNLLEINKVFGSIVFHKDTPISAGVFLSNVCGRLVMMKSHEEGKTYFA